jgi:hypothetical protein
MTMNYIYSHAIAGTVYISSLNAHFTPKKPSAKYGEYPEVARV